MSNLVHGLASGTPKFYIALYHKINHRLVNLGNNCDLKSGLCHAGLKLKSNLGKNSPRNYTVLHYFKLREKFGYKGLIGKP